MKSKPGFRFFARSIFWSVLLYGVALSICNWNDIVNKVTGNEKVVVIYEHAPVSKIRSVNVEQYKERIRITERFISFLGSVFTAKDAVGK